MPLSSIDRLALRPYKTPRVAEAAVRHAEEHALGGTEHLRGVLQVLGLQKVTRAIRTPKRLAGMAL